MTTDESNIIDAEIVETPDLPDLPTPVDHRDASNSGGIHLPNRQDALLEANVERRCVAHKRNGERCRKFAIYGSTVCRTHGGATERVKASARIRVENAQHRLIGKLIEFAFDDAKPPDVQLRAIRDALDRGGLKPPSEVVLSQGQQKTGFEQVWESIGGDPESSGFASPPTAAGVPAEDSFSQRDSAYPTQPPPHHAQAIDRGDTASARKSPESTGAERWRYLRLSDDDLSARGPEDVESSGKQPREEGSPSERDRDRQPEPRERARSQPAPAPRELHITGMTAIRMANEANRASGAMAEQRAITSPHKRYLKP